MDEYFHVHGLFPGNGDKCAAFWRKNRYLFVILALLTVEDDHNVLGWNVFENLGAAESFEVLKENGW